MEDCKLDIINLSEAEKKALQDFLTSVEVQMKRRGQVMDSEIRIVMEKCFLSDLRRRLLSTV